MEYSAITSSLHTSTQSHDQVLLKRRCRNIFWYPIKHPLGGSGIQAETQYLSGLAPCYISKKWAKKCVYHHHHCVVKLKTYILHIICLLIHITTHIQNISLMAYNIHVNLRLHAVAKFLPEFSVRR